MDYKEKYESALERARIWRDKSGMPKDKQGILDDIFPELKESERMRKELINYFTEGREFLSLCSFGRDEIITWLEKQGETDKASYEIAEEEKYDFVSGQFIECRKSFDEFKENNSYWFEYVGNDTYIGRSDNILNKKFHITPRQLYRLFTQQHCPKENNMNEETNAPTGYSKYVDECLNEAAKHFFSEGEDKYSVADLFYAGVRCGKSWSEKQANKSQGKTALETAKEEKTDNANKAEPKFNVGNWVVFAENHNSIYQVERIDNYRYYLRHYLGGTLSLHFDNELIIRPWTLQDAKDGDVLVSDDDERPFIFKGCLDPNHPNCPVAYCGIDTEDLFLIGNNCWWDDGKCHPATKEQRDLLFAKIKEAGYEWDDEKKKLSKRVIDEGKAEMDYCFTKMMNGEKVSSAWSEEDENNLTDTCVAIRKFYHGTNGAQELIDWLKSLKDRYTWKPSEEQMEALESATENCAYSEYRDCLRELIQQLKKL